MKSLLLPSDARPQGARKVYRKPELIELGNVSELTNMQTSVSTTSPTEGN